MSFPCFQKFSNTRKLSDKSLFPRNRDSRVQRNYSGSSSGSRWFPASFPETSKSYKWWKSVGRPEEGNRRRKGRDVELGGRRSFAILPKHCARVCTVVMGCQEQTFAARALYTNTITLLLGRSYRLARIINPSDYVLRVSPFATLLHGSPSSTASFDTSSHRYPHWPTAYKL